MIASLSTQHQPTINAIRELRKLPFIPVECLPKTGMVYEHKGDVVAFGYIYKTDSAISWLEWVTTNPTYSAQARHEALEALIPALVTTAKEGGASVVFTSVTDQALMERYKRLGARVGDTAATNLIWKIGA